MYVYMYVYMYVCIYVYIYIYIYIYIYKEEYDKAELYKKQTVKSGSVNKNMRMLTYKNSRNHIHRNKVLHKISTCTSYKLGFL